MATTKRAEDSSAHGPYRRQPSAPSPLAPADLGVLSRETRTSALRIMVESTDGHLWVGVYGSRGPSAIPRIIWSRTYDRPEGVSDDRCVEVALTQVTRALGAGLLQLPRDK
jgi:hypothetical protein